MNFTLDFDAVTGEELAALGEVNDALAERFATSREKLAAVEEFSSLLLATRA